MPRIGHDLTTRPASKAAPTARRSRVSVRSATEVTTPCVVLGLEGGHPADGLGGIRAAGPGEALGRQPEQADLVLVDHRRPHLRVHVRPGSLASGPMKVYTRTGDDGTTGLFYGGRVAKDSARPWAYGTVDEAQAALGLARAFAEPGGELDQLLVGLGHDLYVLMAELATLDENRSKLTPGRTLVTAEMVAALEELIDATSERFEAPTEFVIPGGDVVAAHLDLARTVVRRAERLAARVAVDGSQVVPYLNRLSDLCWTLARWQEGESLASRSAHGSTG